MTISVYAAGLYRAIPVELKDLGKRFFDNSLIFTGKALQLLNCEETYDTPSYYLCSWWDSGWSVQTALYFGIRGVMNNNLGGDTMSIMAGRFLPNLKKEYAEVFDSDNVKTLLENRNHVGPVTFGFSEDHKLVQVSSGFPFFSAYMWLEGIKNTPLQEYIKDPMAHDVFESWSVANLVSTAPFPYKKQRENGIQGAVPFEKGFWNFSYGGILGVSVGTDILLHKAALRSLSLCMDCRAPEIQYRTDIEAVVTDRWMSIRQHVLDKT